MTGDHAEHSPSLSPGLHEGHVLSVHASNGCIQPQPVASLGMEAEVQSSQAPGWLKVAPDPHSGQASPEQPSLELPAPKVTESRKRPLRMGPAGPKG